MTDIDKHKQIDELPTLQDVGGNHLFKFLLHDLRAFCIAVARQVDKIPLVVDVEMIDEQRFSGRGRCLGQILMIGEHVDQARLADVRPSDKRKFWFVILRALSDSCRRYYIFCLIDNHIANFWPQSYKKRINIAHLSFFFYIFANRNNNH